MRLIRLMLVSVTLVGFGAERGTAQAVYEACYVPSVGAMYFIKLPGLPTACLSQTHTPIVWSDGSTVADGSVTTVKLANGAVTVPKLAFNPALKSELDALTTSLAASGTINGAANPVDWTQLKNVPTGFADGVDASGTGTSDHGGLTGLADDDHPQYLLGNSARIATDGFAVTGTFGTGALAATGGGVRLLWYPRKGAFRAGAALGTAWDDASVGQYSVGLGASPIASGAYAVAMGGATTASGDYSTAFGNAATASGLDAVALGDGTTASGQMSTAMGSGTTAVGQVSTTLGLGTRASGNGSVAMGQNTEASAFLSLAIGRYNVVAGSANSWVPTDPLFVAGMGTSVAAPLNALTLLKNGNLTIAGTLTQSSDIRLKQEIEPLGDALDGVSRLQPIRYRFREGTGHSTEHHFGLAAQDVERVFPELVRRDTQGYLSVSYTELTAVLVRAVQEQQQLNEALRAELAALRAEVAALRAGVDRAHR